MSLNRLIAFVLASLKLANLLEAAIGIEPMNKGFADLCLTTWLRRRRKVESIREKGENYAFSFLPYTFYFR